MLELEELELEDEEKRAETTDWAMEKTEEREELRVELRDVGGGREVEERTEREGALSSMRVSARVPSSQLDEGRRFVRRECYMLHGSRDRE